MTNSMQGVQTWLQEPRLGGIFVLDVEGKPVADTALVNPTLSPEEQIAALADVPWVPPEQLTAEYNSIVSAKKPTLFLRALPGDRRITPLQRGGFGATIDGDEDPSRQPVRRYLYRTLSDPAHLPSTQTTTSSRRGSHGSRA